MARQKMPLLPRIKFSALDYDAVNNDIVQYLKAAYPDNWNDFLESNAGKMFVDMFSYFGELLGYRIDVAANECFLPTARSRADIIRLLQLIDYHLKSVGQASVQIDATRLDTVLTNSAVSNRNVQSRYYDVVVSDLANGINTQLTARGTNGKEVPFTVLAAQYDYDSRVSILHTHEIDNYGNVASVNSAAQVINAYEGIVIYDLITDVTGEEYQTYYTSKGNVVFGSLKVYIDKGLGWELLQPNQYLLNSPVDISAEKIVYRTEYTEDYKARISFGDDKFGGIPKTGYKIKMVYMIGVGELGNVSSRSINKRVLCPIVDNINSQPNSVLDYINVYFINNTPATGGSNPETLSNAIQYAPLTLRANEKMNTREDYKILLENNPSVKEAYVEDDLINDETPVYTVNLYILQNGAISTASYMSLSSSLYNSIKQYVDERKVIGIDNNIFPADVKLVKVEVTVKKNSFANASVVSEKIKLAIEEYVTQTKNSLGTNVEVSEISGLIQSIDGVDYVQSINVYVSPNIVITTNDTEILLSTQRKASDAKVEILHKTNKNESPIFNYLQMAGSNEYDSYYHTYKKLKNSLIPYDKNGVYLGDDVVNNWLLYSYNFNDKYDYEKKVYRGADPKIVNNVQQEARACVVANVIDTYVITSTERTIQDGQEGIGMEYLYNYMFNVYNTNDNLLILNVRKPEGNIIVKINFSRNNLIQCRNENGFSESQDASFPQTGLTPKSFTEFINWYIGKYYSVFYVKDESLKYELWSEQYGDYGIKLLCRYPFSSLDSYSDEAGNILNNNAHSLIGFSDKEAFKDAVDNRYLPCEGGMLLRQGENKLWFKINGNDEIVELPLGKPSMVITNPPLGVSVIGTAKYPLPLSEESSAMVEIDDDMYEIVFSHYPKRFIIDDNMWKLNNELDLSDDINIVNTWGTGSINDILFKMTQNFRDKKVLSTTNFEKPIASDTDIINIWSDNIQFWNAFSVFYDIMRKEVDKVINFKNNPYKYDFEKAKSSIESFVVEIMKQPLGTFKKFVNDFLSINVNIDVNFNIGDDASAVNKTVNLNVGAYQLNTLRNKDEILSYMSKQGLISKEDLERISNERHIYSSLSIASTIMQKYAALQAYLNQFVNMLFPPVASSSKEAFPLVGNAKNFKAKGTFELSASVYIDEYVSFFNIDNNSSEGVNINFIKGAVNDYAGWFSYDKFQKSREFHTLAYTIAKMFYRFKEDMILTSKQYLLQQNNLLYNELPELADSSWDIFSKSDYSSLSDSEIKLLNKEFKEYIANTYVFRVPRSIIEEGEYVIECKAIKNYNDPRFVNLESAPESRVVTIQRNHVDTAIYPIETQMFPEITTLNCYTNTIVMSNDNIPKRITWKIKQQIDTTSTRPQLTAWRLDAFDENFNASDVLQQRSTLLKEGEINSYVIGSALDDIQFDSATNAPSIVFDSADWTKLVCDISFFGEAPQRIVFDLISAFGPNISVVPIQRLIDAINAISYKTFKKPFYAFLVDENRIGIYSALPYVKFLLSEQPKTLNYYIGVENKSINNIVLLDLTPDMFLNRQPGLYYIRCEVSPANLSVTDKPFSYIRVFWNKKPDYTGTLSTEEVAQEIINQIPNENKYIADNVVCNDKQFAMFGGSNNDSIKINVV
jgi:hypothetical protein